MRIAIVGAGGHGEVVQECLDLIHPDGVETVFYDDRYPDLERIGETRVLGSCSDACDPAAPNQAFVAIGENRTRARLIQQLLHAGKTLVTVLHPSCILSPDCQVLEGTIAISGSVINRGASIGRGVILNTLSSAGHGCQLGDFAQLGPGVNLGGGTVLGTGAFMGIGAKVVPGVTIGEWTVVGAGSVVLNDLPPYTFCYGTPARVVRDLHPSERPEANGNTDPGETETSL